jgi:hypothetical protein
MPNTAHRNQTRDTTETAGGSKHGCQITPKHEEVDSPEHVTWSLCRLAKR